MKAKLALGARAILGLIFFIFGLNGFFNFIPQPPMEGAAAAYMGALGATGYFFPVLKLTETLGGLMVLSGKYTAFGVILLAPIIVQITLFHLFLAPSGLGMAAVLVLSESLLVWAYFENYRGIFAQPE